MPNNSTTINNLENSRAAEQAAALIKSTAENTATALNISYIQRDILEIKQDRQRDMTEIKQAIRDASSSFATKAEVAEISKIQVDHEDRIRNGESNQFKWLGAISILSIVISVAIAYFLKIVK